MNTWTNWGQSWVLSATMSAVLCCRQPRDWTKMMIWTGSSLPRSWSSFLLSMIWVTRLAFILIDWLAIVTYCLDLSRHGVGWDTFVEGQLKLKLIQVVRFYFVYGYFFYIIWYFVLFAATVYLSIFVWLSDFLSLVFGMLSFLFILKYQDLKIKLLWSVQL